MPGEPLDAEDPERAVDHARGDRQGIAIPTDNVVIVSPPMDDGSPVTEVAAEAAPPLPSDASWWHRLRSTSFGPADERPYRRRYSDWIRLVLAVAFLAWAISHHAHLWSFERNLFTLLNDLPSGLGSLVRALYAFDTLWAVMIVVLAAIVGRRWRLARDLALAGGLA